MQSWFDAFKHMKIKNKISLLIAFIVAVTFSFTVIVQQYAFSIYDRQLYEKSSQVLNLSSSAIETELKRIGQISYKIIADAQIQKLLLSVKTSESDYERLVVHQDVIDRLFNYAGLEPFLHSIHLFDSRGTEHAAGNLTVIHPSKKERIMQAAKEAKGGIAWIFPDEQDNALILARDIRSFHKTNIYLQHVGTMAVRINIQEIVRYIAKEKFEGDLVMLSGSEIIHPLNPSFDPVLANGPFSGSTGYFTRSTGSRSYFISYHKSSGSGWTYVNMTPYDEIFKRVLFVKELVVAVFIAIFAAVILLGVRFSRSLTRPIELLMWRMKLAEKGNFAEANLLQPDKSPMAMDEIGLLHRTFRLMIERINTLITENYANRLLLKETEFKALQAQINPHFLYNTLDSINWLARTNGQKQISQMVESLGFLLRNAVQLNEPLVSLAEELEIVENYVTIQKYRFEERLEFIMDVPEQLRHRKIPKLTLQPLVENAMHYALEPGIGTCTIAVRAWETAEAICITVEDDGPGIPEDTLDRLRRGELKTKGKGIGLLNIDERIKIAFGDDYGIRIGGTAGGGARITIALPVETEETNDV
ncbi:cache domain-containing sensor histidine kinase [Paenibacillus alkalitolerans]|uniref:cache domain-containing sensor histidine kinase n=1 Tax=Paenibacillus alkalitolerans TaxID=2799335 RepID=UPI001F42ED82|nr:sensor histidine kinase [Paenibacillus alkalitolerans]